MNEANRRLKNKIRRQIAEVDSGLSGDSWTVTSVGSHVASIAQGPSTLTSVPFYKDLTPTVGSTVDVLFINGGPRIIGVFA